MKIFRFATLTHFIVRIKYTSNMAAWFMLSSLTSVHPMQ